MSKNLFATFDFTLLDAKDFKEDSVREEIIAPMLNALGYSANPPHQIVRSRTLSHPFVSIGSKKRKINVIPDYLLEVDGNVTLVLDAKAPDETIQSGKNVEQAFSYAIHPDIRANYFALCNGREFIVFQTDKKEPILYFQISEFNKYWAKFKNLLEPSAFISVTNSQQPTANSRLIIKQSSHYLK